MLTALQASTVGLGRMSHARNGATQSWKDPALSLHWDFKLLKPGRFRVEILTMWHGKTAWQTGRHVAAEIDSQRLTGELRKNRLNKNPRTQYQKEVISVMGHVQLDSPGQHTATLKLLDLPSGDPGVELSHIRLVRID